MLEYIIAGLVIGGIYAVVASGLVVTYTASGILNFAYGALAYFVARCYYFFHTQQGWGIAPAALLSIVVIGPALGAFLYATLFRLLRNASMLLQIVVTIGLSVAIPPISDVMFGNPVISIAPGLAPEPVHVYKVFGAAITLDQVIVLAVVAATLIGGTLIFRFTSAGLMVRAMVDSPAMTSLTGTNPGTVSMYVWVVSVFLAGLVGVLVAPISGLSSEEFTFLMTTAFAAMIVGEMVNFNRAVIVAFAIGIIDSLLQGYLPPQSALTADIVESVPFAIMFVFLLVAYRRLATRASRRSGGVLDRAIAPPSRAEVAQLRTNVPLVAATAMERREFAKLVRYDHLRAIGFLSQLAIVCLLPLVLPNYWVGLVAEGLCFAIAFLSFTLVTGEGGMIWLCMVSFTGFGAVMTAYLATDQGWPLLAAVLASSIMVVPVGMLLSFVTSRMGGLYVALVTLTFGLLLDNLFFSRQVFQNYGLGIKTVVPSFARSNTVQVYLLVGVFCLIALGIEHLRRSTAALGLMAARSREVGARALGINSVGLKVVVAGAAAAVAALGGGLLAIQQGEGNPTFYTTVGGLVWLALVATLGIRLNLGALMAGINFVIIPALFATFLPTRLSEVPAFLFGFGAIMLIRNPDGAFPMQGRQIRTLLRRWNIPRQPATETLEHPGVIEPGLQPSGASPPITVMAEAGVSRAQVQR